MAKHCDCKAQAWICTGDNYNLLKFPVITISSHAYDKSEILKHKQAIHNAVIMYKNRFHNIDHVWD